MSNKVRKAHKDTSGFRERPMESFTDVKHALTAYLRKTDQEYRKRSDDSQRRSIESHERKRREREGKFEMKLNTTP